MTDERGPYELDLAATMALAKTIATHPAVQGQPLVQVAVALQIAVVVMGVTHAPQFPSFPDEMLAIAKEIYVKGWGQPEEGSHE